MHYEDTLDPGNVDDVDEPKLMVDHIALVVAQ